MTTRAIFVLTAAAVLPMSLLSAPALAEDGAFYVGANVGRVLDSWRRSNIDGFIDDQFSSTTDSGFSMVPSSTDKSRTMWAVDVGYMVTTNIGIEASYIDLGKLRYQAIGTTTTTGIVDYEVDLDLRTHGPALALVGVLPMTNWWELDARAGAMEAKVKNNYSSAIQGQTTLFGSPSKTTTAVMLGAGTGFDLTSHWIARLEYLRLQNIDEPLSGHSFNVDVVTVGINYVF